MSKQEIRNEEVAGAPPQWAPFTREIDEEFGKNWRKWNPIAPPMRQNGDAVRQFIDAWNSADFDTIASLTSTNAVHHTRYSDYRIEGMQLVRNLLNGVIPDLSVKVEEVRDEGHIIVAQVSVSGTNTGALLDLAPSNQPISFTATEIFRLEDGLITEHWWGFYNGLASVDEDGLNPVIGLIFAC